MPLHTLKGWLKESRKGKSESAMPSSLPQSLPARQWSAAERLLALHESHCLSGEALHAWCREKGLFEHQLTAWREAFCSGPEPETAQERRESKAELWSCPHPTDRYWFDFQAFSGAGVSTGGVASATQTPPVGNPVLGAQSHPALYCSS